MNIKEFIIHRIEKEQHNDPQTHLRGSALDSTDSRVMRFTTLAVNVFKVNEGRPSSVFADFNADETTYPFSNWCRSYFSDCTDFVEFTQNCTRRLANQMQSQKLSTGGYVVFTTFDSDGITKLLIVMLHSHEGLSITEDLEFADVDHLELKHIDKAALITGPTNGEFGVKPVTYAGFRKEMSRYFQEFIGPDAFRQPKRDTARLIQVLENYAKANRFDDAQLDEVRIKLRKYAKDCENLDQELDLQVVSAIVHPTEPHAFSTYASEEGISAFIKPDNGVFKRWKVIRHKSSDGLIIQFKAETVGGPGTNHRLIFDSVSKTLTITQLEDELVKKINATKAENP